MIDKTLATCLEAVAPVFDGATVMLGGFGDVGMPGQLIEAVRIRGARDLTTKLLIRPTTVESES